MAKNFYDKGRQKILEGSIAHGSDTIKACLVVAAYTFNQAHEFVDDLGANRIGTDQTLANKTTTNGVFKNTVNTTWSSVAGGSSVESIVIYKDTGSTATSPLIFYIDDYTNMPYSTNGGDIVAQWDQGANGIYKI